MILYPFYDKRDTDKGLFWQIFASLQRQRVSIARALATRPEVLILDEPFHDLFHGRTEMLATIAKGAISAGLLIYHGREFADPGQGLYSNP